VGVARNALLAASYGGHLIIGKSVQINRNCILVSKKSITIGNGCSIGPNVCIYDHDHAFGKQGKIPGKFKVGEIVIGNNCWIGTSVIILRDTKIGDNCVIGAGAVIQGNIPSYSLVTADRKLAIIPLR
jgi:acetyltransferase-like isoleucine patch superfamily enzyme